jgi:hypothetical protein
MAVNCWYPMLRSDAMPDPRPTSSRPAAAAREADGQCRGIGPILTPTGAEDRGRGRGLRGAAAGDVSVARSVVRDADGPADGRRDGDSVRAAMALAATAAVTQDAAERAALESRRAPTADDPADRAGLLDSLRTAVARYVSDRRRAGAPIERVLPEVKGLVRQSATSEGWFDPAKALLPQVVGWTIATYYDEPEPSQQGQTTPPQRPGTPHVAERR